MDHVPEPAYTVQEVQPLAINTKSRKSIDLGTFGTTDKDFDLEEDDLKAIADRDKDDQFLEQQNYLLEFEKTLERDVTNLKKKKKVFLKERSNLLSLSSLLL